MTSFILIRHAEAAWSVDEGRPLSADGLREAEALSERLARFAIDAIYSSPYRRALQTAAPLARRLGLEVVELPELRERALGHFPGGSFSEAMAASWADFELRHPGGESCRSAQDRILDAVRSLARRHPSQTVALATHGNLLALLLHAFDRGVGFEFWRSLTFPDAFELHWASAGGGVFRRIEHSAA